MIKIKKTFFLLSCLIFIQSAFAQNSELVINLINNADQVLAAKEKAITLEELKSMVVNENLDVKISYERLVQAQKHIGNARAQYFPYGVGTVAAIYFTGAFSYLIAAELITSLPMKIFTVRKNKFLRNAQSFNVKAVKENIKNQVALTYYNLLSEEALLKLAKYEVMLLEELHKAMEERAILGLATENEITDVERRIFEIRDIYLKFKAYYLEERKALNILMGVDFNSPVIELQPVSERLSSEFQLASTDGLLNSALERSYELKAANQLIYASVNERRSAQWSFLSFSGIGFGYFYNIKAARSKTQETKLLRNLLETKISNQVYTKKSKLIRSIGISDKDYELASLTRVYTQGDVHEYVNGQLTLDKVIETELIFLQDLREQIRSHYDALIKKDDLERLIQGKITNEDNNVILGDINVH